MTPEFRQLLNKFESDIALANRERELDLLPDLAPFQMKVVGQMALLLHPSTSRKLHIAQAADLVALLSGDWAVRALLKKRLAENGLVYDELSEGIWIPPGAEFAIIHDSSALVVQALHPLHVLTSKALKAPAKNRILIQEAIAIYGEPLITLITGNGGDINYFLTP